MNSALMLKQEMDCRKAARWNSAEAMTNCNAPCGSESPEGLGAHLCLLQKIRNDQGFWQQLEEYIQQHSEAEFSHGLCTPASKALPWCFTQTSC